jgi:N6-L-threonylcarbamoyladenine synthase
LEAGGEFRPPLFINMRIFAIETSCDETSAAVVEVQRGQFNILSNIVSSQVKIHARYGGVVPEVAARLHIEKIIPIIAKAFKDARTTLTGVDYLAVCSGPGLISSLMVGVETAKALAYATGKPLVRINHLEGHLFSILGKLIKNQENKKSKKQEISARGGFAYGEKKSRNQKILFPAIALIVSGGHTQLILVKGYLKYKLIGETRDDAAGEAFDKAAKLLGLGYPGGPAISAAAANRPKSTIQTFGRELSLPRPMLNSNDFDFSFAGLKTAVLYGWNDLKKKLDEKKLSGAKSTMAREFQQAVIDVLIAKTFKAAKRFNSKTIILGGGVTANNELRRQFVEKAKKDQVDLLLPPLSLAGDNAGMIAIAAYYHIQKKNFISPFKLTANPEQELV